MNTFPVIRLEVESMKYSIKAALSQRVIDIDSGIQQALDEFCTESRINDIVRKEAMECINDAVKEEVRNFFRYSGNGRKAIKEAVVNYLDDVYPDEA